MDQQLTRNKIRRRRWIIFGSVAIFLIVTVGGLYGVRKVRHLQHIDGLKEAAYASMEAGDAKLAYHQFRGYLSRYPEDLEAIRGLAEAIKATGKQQRQDPSELINIYRRLLALEPGDLSVQSELMELYHRINFAKEAIELADQLLEEDATFTRARIVRSLQHARLRQYAVAIEDCKLILEIEPENLQTRLLLLQLQVRNNELDSELLEWGGDLTKVIEWGETQPAYDAQSSANRLVLGYTYQLIGQTQQAAAIYQSLAQSDLDEIEVISLLAGYMELVGLMDESVDLLTRATNDIGVKDLRPELVRRLWERYRVDEVITSFGGDHATALNEPGSYPFVVYALYATGERDAADGLVKEGASSDDPYIQIWADLFASISQEVDTETKRAEILSKAKLAVQSYPTDPHLRAEYAKQLLASRYTEAAVAEWERVASDAPGWSRPMQQVAEIMLATQRDALALEPAKAAVRRAPNLLQGILIYFRAVSANLDRLSVDEFNRVRTLVDQVQNEAKSESLIPLRIELTARNQRDTAQEDAAQQLDAAMSGDPEYAISTWIALIRISQRHGLDKSTELIEKARLQHGPSPELAITRAIDELSKENPDEQAVLAIFDDWRSDADEEDELSWQIARARLERAVDPGKAVAIWEHMLERFPEEQLVQVQILQDELNWQQEGLQLIRSVLDKHQEGLAETEIAPVRIAHARLMLMDAESDQELAEVASYLIDAARDYPYLSEPQTLLGICYERQGNRSRALNAYTSAHRVRPGSDALLSSRIRLHRELGEAERANNLIAQYADQLADSLTADPARLAQTFAMVGDLEQATVWAERAIQKNTADRTSALLLARLYLAARRENDAERIYKRLLVSPDLGSIIAAASFYIQTGRQEEGAALIERLDELEVEEATRAVVRGHFELSTGDLDSAQVQYEKAAARGDSLHATTAFVRLISIELSQSDLNGVMQVAQAASKRLPDDQRFKAIAENEVLIRSVYGPTTTPFIRRLLVDPDQRPVVESALRIAREMASLPPRREQDENDAKAFNKQLAELRRLADQNQRLVELQNLLVRKYINSGQPELAIEIASRTTQMFPKNESVLIAAADANMAAQRWDSAAQVGNQIAELNPSYQAAADIVAARAALRRGLPNEAVRLMEPYIEIAENVPDRYEPVIRVYVSALIAANRKPDDLGKLKASIFSTIKWQNFILNQIVEHETTQYETASAWIRSVMQDAKAFAGERFVMMQIQAATAWHMTGIRDPSNRGQQEATAILEALKGNPQAETQAVLFNAIFAKERGDYKDAEQGYRSVLAAQPNNLIALNNLSMVLVELNQGDEALEFAKRAAKGAPEAPIILDTLANAQLAAGQAIDATATIERAIDLEPKGIPWHITLCRALMAKQDPTAATEALETYQYIGELINSSEQLDASLSQEYLSLRSELDQLLGSSTASPVITD